MQHPAPGLGVELPAAASGSVVFLMVGNRRAFCYWDANLLAIARQAPNQPPTIHGAARRSATAA